MAVKKITPKNPDTKASAAKGEKKADERKTSSAKMRKVGRSTYSTKH
jgi:hypothetical protein